MLVAKADAAGWRHGGGVAALMQKMFYASTKTADLHITSWPMVGSCGWLQALGIAVAPGLVGEAPREQ